MEKIFKLGEKEYPIRKMSLGRFSNLLSTIEELPSSLVSTDEMTKEAFIAKIPQIAGQAFPKFIKALSVATDIPENILTEQVGIAEGMELVGLVWDVNEVERIKNAFRGMVSKWKTPVPQENQDKKEKTG